MPARSKQVARASHGQLRWRNSPQLAPDRRSRFLPVRSPLQRRNTGGEASLPSDASSIVPFIHASRMVATRLRRVAGGDDRIEAFSSAHIQYRHRCTRMSTRDGDRSKLIFGRTSR